MEAELEIPPSLWRGFRGHFEDWAMVMNSTRRPLASKTVIVSSVSSVRSARSVADDRILLPEVFDEEKKKLENQRPNLRFPLTMAWLQRPL